MKPEDKLDMKQRRQQADRLISHGGFDQAVSVYHEIIRRYSDSYAACERSYVDIGGTEGLPHFFTFPAHPRIFVGASPETADAIH